MFLVIGFVSGVPIYKIIGIDWQYEAPITYSATSILVFSILTGKGYNEFLSLNIAVNMIFASGFIYEMFVYGYTIYGHFIHLIYVFLIEPSSLATITLIYFLREVKFKPDKITITFLAFSIFYAFMLFLNHGIPHPRLPITLTMLYIALKIPNIKKSQVKHAKLTKNSLFM